MTGIGSIGERFSRSWSLTKKTFAVMQADKELLIFPIMNTIFSVLLVTVILFPWLVALLFSSSVADLSLFIMYVGLFASYFVISFSTAFFNAGMVHIVHTRFTGGDATLMDGIREAFRHFGSLLGWSLITATVGLILNALSNKSREKGGIVGFIGGLVVSFIGFAWAIISVFVIPAMVLQNIGPIDALKSTGAIIKKTWGERLIQYYGLRWSKGIVSLAAFLLFGLPGFLLLSPALPLGVFLLILWVLVGILIMVFFSAANVVYTTALYLYATTGKVPEFFTKEEITHAFVKE